MWRGDQTGLASGGPGLCDALLPWHIIGPDLDLLASHIQSLAHFGIAATLDATAGLPCALTPVLSDARCQKLVRQLLDLIPHRRAPLVFCNVNGAQARARLLLAGADDALSARVAPCELAARLTAAARARNHRLGTILLAGFGFDTGLRQVTWRGLRLQVMPREFDLLLAMARHGGNAVSRQTLLRSVWQTAFDPGTNSVEVHICKLRRHLAPLGDLVRIDTVKGQGYRLVTPI